MAGNIHLEYIDIFIRAHNEAKEAYASATADATGFQDTVGSAAKGVVLATLAAGAVLAAGAATAAVALTKAGMDYQTQLSQLQANTTITNAQIGSVSAAVLKMHADTGAPIDQLIQSFQHVTDAGFTVAQAMQIVKQGTMSAVATGANAADINNTLGIVMHEFAMKAGEAAKATNVLHLASAESNTTMEQFATGTAKAQAFAANLGVSFTTTEAALAALGRRFSANQSSTMFAGELVKIVAASKGAEAALAQMQARTGLPLVKDFTQAGLASRGFTQVQADLAKGVKETGIQLMTLIPATRGGLAAMVLGGTGAKDYATILQQLNATMAGKTNPTMEAFTRQQATLTGQLQDLGGAAETAAITFGLQLVPVVTLLVRDMAPAIKETLQWADAHAYLAAQIGKIAVGKIVQLAHATKDIVNAVVALGQGNKVMAFVDLDNAVNSSTGKLRNVLTDLRQIARLMNDIHQGNWAAAAGIIAGQVKNAFKPIPASQQNQSLKIVQDYLNPNKLPFLQQLYPAAIMPPGFYGQRGTSPNAQVISPTSPFWNAFNPLLAAHPTFPAQMMAQPTIPMGPPTNTNVLSGPPVVNAPVTVHVNTTGGVSEAEARTIAYDIAHHLQIAVLAAQGSVPPRAPHGLPGAK